MIGTYFDWIVRGLTALGVILTAVSSLLNGWQQRRSDRKLVAKVDENTKITQDTHEATNGKMAELLNVVQEASFAKGVKSETDKH